MTAKQCLPITLHDLSREFHVDRAHLFATNMFASVRMQGWRSSGGRICGCTWACQARVGLVENRPTWLQTLEISPSRSISKHMDGVGAWDWTYWGGARRTPKLD
jgi:hypothetical protein